MKIDFSRWATALLLMLGLPLAGRSQSVGIGTTTPDAKAALDIRATDKGLLVPRLSAAQRTGIASPPQGLMVYQTDASEGFYYFGGGPTPAWVFINPAGGGADNLGNHTATTTLNLGANALTGTGASLGAAVGVGVRADGGLNLGQNTAGKNVYLGYQSGQLTQVGPFSFSSLFVGYQAGAANTTGSANQFSGYRAGFRNKTGDNNQFSGYESGFANTTSDFNQFSGFQSGFSNTEGSANQFSGYQAGYFNTIGSNNQFSGFKSGQANTTGSRNWAFGYGAGPTSGNLTNAGAIGYGAQVGASNSLVLGGAGADAVQVGIGTGAPAARLHVYGSGPTVLRLQSSNGFGPAGVEFWSDPQGSVNEWRPAFIRSADGNGGGGYVGSLVFYTNGAGFANRTAAVEQMRVRNGGVDVSGDLFVVGDGRISNLVALGTVVANRFLTGSDQRLKTAVRPLRGALAGVLALRPVRYRWNAAGVRRGGLPGAEQIGLLAQQVEKVYPELVSTAPDGYKSVNYAQLTPVLLAAVKELAADNDTLRRQLEQDRQQLQRQQRQARAAAEAQAAGFAQRLRALEAAGAQAAAGR